MSLRQDLKDFRKEDFNWTEKAVVGMALLMIGGTTDSFGDKIMSNIYYEVGKHKTTGETAILPTKKNQKEDFVNNILKKQNKFN